MSASLSVPHTNDPAAFGASTPFILIARVQVKPGKVKEYLAIADQADLGVSDSEPGMLHHTFDVSEDDDHAYTWSEVYQNDAALEAHLSNPVVGAYLQDHAAVCESFSVEVYGTLSDKTAKAARALPFPVKIWKTALGYSRVK